MASDLPTVIYVDGSENGRRYDDDDLIVDDDDMLDITDEFENQQRNYHRLPEQLLHSSNQFNHPTAATTTNHNNFNFHMGQQPSSLRSPPRHSASFSSAQQHHRPSPKTFQRQAPVASFSSDAFLFHSPEAQALATPSRLRDIRASTLSNNNMLLKREGQSSLMPGSHNFYNNGSDPQAGYPANNNSSNPNGYGGGNHFHRSSPKYNSSSPPSIASGGYHSQHDVASSAIFSQTAATGTSVSVSSTHLASQYMEGMRRLSRSIRQTEMTRNALRREGVSLKRSIPSRSNTTHSLPPEMLVVATMSRSPVSRSTSFSSQHQQQQQQHRSPPSHRRSPPGRSTSLRVTPTMSLQRSSPSPVSPTPSPPPLVVADIEENEDDFDDDDDDDYNDDNDDDHHESNHDKKTNQHFHRETAGHRHYHHQFSKPTGQQQQQQPMFFSSSWATTTAETTTEAMEEDDLATSPSIAQLYQALQA